MNGILQIFLTLCRATLSAAGLILCILLLRALLIKWAPCRAVVLLWLAVALRLLIPVSIEVPWPALPQAPVTQVPAETGTVLEWGTDASGEVLAPLPSVSVDPSDTVKPSLEINTTISSVGALLWLLGVAALGLYAAVSYLRLARRVADGVPYIPVDGGGAPLSLPRRVKVKRCGGITSPFIMGIITPCVYLPYGLDGRTEACVLSHELAHIRRGDHMIKPLAFVLIALHWFNPLVWVAWILYCRDTEAACDERAVADMTLGERKIYAAALVTLLPKAGEKRARAPLCPPAFGETGVKSRVKRILAFKKPLLWTVIPLLLVAAILTAVFFMTAPEADPDRGEWEGVITVQGSVCDFEGVYLTLHTYRPDKDGAPYLRLTLDNQSGETIGYGEPYEIYYLDGDTWVNTEVYGTSFILPLYLLEPQASATLEYTPAHCDLSRYGTYKFVTDITYPINEYGASKSCEISLTFVLEGTGDVIGTYPEDFAIHFEAQTGKYPNCLDTFDGYVQKDLVQAFPGYAKASLKLTDAERQYLWEITKQCGMIGRSGDFSGSTVSPDGIVADVEPNCVYTVTISANGETYTLTGDRTGEFLGKHTDFYTYIHLLQAFMCDTDEWQGLPAAEGGYD